jgi:homoserine dehydrogenase
MNIGICGLGTVASGVVNVMQRNADLHAARAGEALTIAKIAARRDNPHCDIHQYTISRDVFDVVRDPEIDIVVELIGGTDTAKELVLEAIQAGKHVVTANKALIAEHGNEILSAAQKNNVSVRFEAAVAGGIPVIKALSEGLAANRIESIAGIINGTGNFILTEMAEKNRNFDDALADAQALGYAEADPTYDVEGIDAAQKLVILSALAFGTSFDLTQCYIEGISAVLPEDIRTAAEMGYSIKHLGLARRVGDALEMRVHPALVPTAQLIANVDGVMNAVYIKGDAVGPTLHYGAGAGAEPTASAVIADIIDTVRYSNATNIGTDSVDQKIIWPSVLSIDDIQSAYYLRLTAANKPGTLSQVTQILSDADISVQAMHQQEQDAAHEAADTVPVVLSTNKTRESNLREAIARIEQLAAISLPVVTLRIEPLD